MMLSILCALFALIVLMSCAAVRAARAMRSGPGTEAQATRADLSTEAQATSTGRPSGRKPKPPLPPLRKVGRRKATARAARRPSAAGPGGPAREGTGGCNTEMRRHGAERRRQKTILGDTEGAEGTDKNEIISIRIFY